MAMEPQCRDKPRSLEWDDYDGERLDTCKAIARYLGVSESYFYAKVKHRMDHMGILFTRPKPGGHRVTFTYKRLVLIWLITAKGEL